MRADHLGFNGYNKKLTPFLDKLAKEGMNFTHAFSNGPFSPASYVSMFTSATSLDYLSHSKYPKEATNIAEVLKNKGWTTVGFNKNAWCSKFFGYDVGFDHYDDFMLGEEKKEKNIFGKIEYSLQTKFGQNSKFVSVFRRIEYFKKTFNPDKELFEASEVNKKVFNWLDNNHKEDNFKKFFMWLVYMDVHPPYYPPQKFINFVNPEITKRNKQWLNSCTSEQMSKKDREKYHNLFEANLMYMDSEIKKVYEKLEKLGILKDTMIIIAADHGFEFWEHNWLGMKAKMYEENIRVPLIIWNGGVKGSTDKLVTLRDIPATICDVFGVEHKFLSNNNLLKYKGEEYIYSECSYNPLRGPIYVGDEEKYRENIIYCIRSKRYKYIYDEGNKKEEFYDLEEDKDEKVNLIENGTVEIDVFRKLLKARKDKIFNQMKVKEFEKDIEEDIIDELEV